jgi:hypothetical protein
MTLDAAHPDTLPVHYTGAYSLMEIPPRCRNPRPVRYQADFTLPVRSVTGRQAPVAMTYTTATGRDTSPATVLRFFDGHLYSTVTHTTWPRTPEGVREAPVEVATEYGSDNFPAKASLITRDWGTVDSLEEVTAFHARHLARFLVIDGVIWERANEPRYVVVAAPYPQRWDKTRGPWIEITVTDTDNAHDNPRHIFRADQHAAALAAALEMARELGAADDRLAELTSAAPKIAVHLPEAVQLVVPAQEHKELSKLREGLQSALREADRALTAVDRLYADPERDPARAEEFGVAWEKLTSLHEQILTLTDDVVGVDAVRRPYMRNDAAERTA